MHLLARVLALWHVANGAAMLALPGIWFRAVPGAAETGPANIHFIRDIGIAFLAAGLALSLWRGERALALVALAFTGGHAVLHLAGAAQAPQSAPHLLRDAALVALPGLAPLALLLQPKGTPA